MEILTKLNIKEKAEINFNDIRQRDSRQVELSKEEISRLIARYNSGIKDKKEWFTWKIGRGDIMKKFRNANETTREFIKENAVDEDFLQNWYQDSVLETDIPVWTDEHIAEMIGDFYLIPREVIDGREN